MTVKDAVVWRGDRCFPVDTQGVRSATFGPVEHVRRQLSKRTFEHQVLIDRILGPGCASGVVIGVLLRGVPSNVLVDDSVDRS